MEAVCLASGPSLTEADVALVAEWRQQPDRIVIVTNTTFRIAPWADYLYAMDRKWWEHHIKEVRAVFKGRLVSNNNHAKQLGLTHTGELFKRFDAHQNSGAAAISLAVRLGASRVIMLGYDCGVPKGQKAHWHGDHPKPLGNCGSSRRWPQQFQKLRDTYKAADIVNASRFTMLGVFPKCSLEDALSPRLQVAA